MKALYTLILVLFSVTANAAYFKSDFPRLGGTKIGSPQDYHVPNFPRPNSPSSTIS